MKEKSSRYEHNDILEPHKLFANFVRQRLSLHISGRTGVAEKLQKIAVD